VSTCAKPADHVEHLVFGGEVEDQQVLVGGCAAGTSVDMRGELEVVLVAGQTDHHDLVSVRGGPVQLRQAQVGAVELEDLIELVGRTRDADLDGREFIRPDAIGKLHGLDGRTSSNVDVNRAATHAVA
jgi:hypothetical protein